MRKVFSPYFLPLIRLDRCQLTFFYETKEKRNLNSIYSIAIISLFLLT